MSDDVLPLERTSFTPLRTMGEIASPNGRHPPIPGPGALPHPDREAIMTAIVRGIANGLTVNQVLDLFRDQGVAGVEPNTIYQWRARFPTFRDAFDAARAVSGFVLLDRAAEAAETAVDRESAFAARVRADIAIRLAEKWAPERFGPRVQQAAAVQVVIRTSLPPPNRLDTDGFHLSVPAPQDRGNDDDGFCRD